MILHHYDFSNFSEKIRLILGFKRLAWDSVVIPAWEPKPDYVPLTAGYRRTPALQIGADVYCDTRLITAQLEALAPTPSLFPDRNATHLRALTEVLVSWAESSLMRPLALYITGLHADEFPAEFHADRARLHGKAQPSVAQVRAAANKYRAQVEIGLGMLEDLLVAEQDYVLPQGLSLADFALYEAPWFLKVIAGSEALDGRSALLRAWAARVGGVGHGHMTERSPAEALAVARAATPLAVERAARDSAEGIAPGESVTVSPFDQYSPASGVLLRVDSERITIASEHPATGLVHVHFPRLGYRLSRPRV